MKEGMGHYGTGTGGVTGGSGKRSKVGYRE